MPVVATMLHTIGPTGLASIPGATASINVAGAADGATYPEMASQGNSALTANTNAQADAPSISTGDVRTLNCVI